jgi:hypothetical protein
MPPAVGGEGMNSDRTPLRLRSPVRLGRMENTPTPQPSYPGTHSLRRSEPASRPSPYGVDLRSSLDTDPRRRLPRPAREDEEMVTNAPSTRG